MICRTLFFGLAFIASVAFIRCSNKHESALLLVLATQDNFGLYTGEILKAEGFSNFKIDSPGVDLTLEYLTGFDIVILAETKTTPEQQQMLAEYVQRGGSLIAFRPDKKLSAVFGIATASGEFSEPYISINDSTPIGKEITSETLQIHGIADQYRLESAQPFARFFKDNITSTAFPAVVMNDYGSGKAIAFLYNLPQSIVLTRQGNVNHAGKEMDGILGIRAMDMFAGGWVDTSKNILNQADEQMRLLTHCIEHLSTSKKPIPRFWYFPDTVKCLVTLNNDAEDSREVEFGPQFEDVHAKGAKMTLYIKEVELISKSFVDTWKKRGFEISGHPDLTGQAVDPDWNTMDSAYKALQNELKINYGISAMQTVTNHWFVWVGKNADGSNNFAAQARIEENNGIGLDCNYAHYDNNSNQGHFLGEPGTNQGNYTGTGLPMRFADNSGKLINVYQQLNNVYDQQYMEHKDQDGYYNAFKGLMDRSLDHEVFSTISVRAHNNEYFFSKVPLMKMLDYANSRAIPVWTELKLLEFLRVKDEATFSGTSWSDNRLSFQIKSGLTHSNGLTYLVPHTFNKKTIRGITSNGMDEPYAVKSIKGFEYAWVTIKPGKNYTIEISYGD